MEPLLEEAEIECCSKVFYENKTQAELLLFLIFPLAFNVEDIRPTKSAKVFVESFKHKAVHGILLNQLDMYYKVMVENLLPSKIQLPSIFLRALLYNALDVTAILLNIIELGVEDDELGLFLQLSENMVSKEKWDIFLKDYSISLLLSTIKKVHVINKKLLKRFREILKFVPLKKPDIWLNETCVIVNNFIKQQGQGLMLSGGVDRLKNILSYDDSKATLTEEEANCVIYMCADFAKRYARFYRGVKDVNENRKIFFKRTKSIFFKIALAFVRLVSIINNEKKSKNFMYIDLKELNPLDEFSRFGGFLHVGSTMDFETVYATMLQNH